MPSKKLEKLPDDVRGRFHADPWSCPWCGADRTAPKADAAVATVQDDAVAWSQGRLRLIRHRCLACKKAWIGVYAAVGIEAVDAPPKEPEKTEKDEPVRA